MIDDEDYFLFPFVSILCTFCYVFLFGFKTFSSCFNLMILLDTEKPIKSYLFKKKKRKKVIKSKFNSRYSKFFGKV